MTEKNIHLENENMWLLAILAWGLVWNAVNLIEEIALANSDCGPFSHHSSCIPDICQFWDNTTPHYLAL